MRIASATIRNYRCLRDVTVNFDKYGVLIGPNGSGKSSVLYALDWFFNGGELTESDVHGYAEDVPLSKNATIQVEVTFADLSGEDRAYLHEYGRAETVRVRRTWYAETNKTKTVGNARQGPGFATVRDDSQGIAQRRQAYRELRDLVDGLAPLPSPERKDDMLAALLDWENDPANRDLLVEVPDAEADHMLGWNGSNAIRRCVRYILVPAAKNIAGEVGATSRGSALTELVGTLVAEANTHAQQAWLESNSSTVQSLYDEVKASIEDATDVQQERINTRLRSLVPGATVRLAANLPTFVPRLDPSITTSVTLDSVTTDVARQGHGVQRAVMIAMFQALVPDETLVRASASGDDGSQVVDGGGLPSVIVAVEEPEIYQHPVRARAFARTLLELSRQPRAQVLLATHSPYFVEPGQFAALRRVTRFGNETTISSATVESVAATSAIERDKIEKVVAEKVPTEFSEGFFADCVVLVEGQTDRVVLESLAEKLGKQLDLRGIVVLSVGGKGGIRPSLAVLKGLGIPAYVVVDGDAGTADRKSYKDDAAREAARGTHRRDTMNVVAGLPSSVDVRAGSAPYNFGDPTIITSEYAIWRSDIEEELQTWGSFSAALSRRGIDLAARENKNLVAYRQAVLEAKTEDLPAPLKQAVLAMTSCSDFGGPAGERNP